MERRGDFASCPESVGAVRQLVRTTLDEEGRHDMVERAALTVSELATNAVLHGACASFSVELSVEPWWVSVAVVDASSELPIVLVDLPVNAVGGHGLAMVSTLADLWGVEAFDGGKRVWARFSVLP